MCDPISAAIIGGIASMASSAMAGMAQKSAVEQQNRLQQAAMARSRQMRQEEQARQDAMRNENAKTLDETIERYDPNAQETQLKKTQQDRVDTSQQFADSVAAMTPEGTPIPGANEGSAVVTDDLSKRLAIAAAKSREKIAAFAKLGGYDENFTANSRANDAANRATNLVNNMRQGSLATSQAGIGLVNQNVGKADPPDLTGSAIVGGLGNALSGAIKGGVFG